MAKITVNKIEYNTEDLSKEANAQLNSVAFVAKRIEELRAETAALETARRAYLREFERLVKE